jgi:hypothetical protein
MIGFIPGEAIYIERFPETTGRLTNSEPNPAKGCTKFWQGEPEVGVGKVRGGGGARVDWGLNQSASRY